MSRWENDPRIAFAERSVLSTARSAIEAGFRTVILGAAVRGIQEDGVRRAFTDLEAMGGIVISEDDWRSALKQSLGSG